MTEEIKNDIDKLDGMVKTKKCGYEFIGGCSDLRHLEQENKELKEDVLKWQKAFSRQYQINENKGYSKVEESYRSALEEILEIAKFNLFYNPEDLLINGDIGQIRDLKMTEIYNRINEVLGE